MIITDRYGGHYPDPRTACNECDAMGVFPLFDERGMTAFHRCRYDAVMPIDALTEGKRALWERAHADAGDHNCDGWHFVACPSCGGSGKTEPEAS